MAWSWSNPNQGIGRTPAELSGHVAIQPANIAPLVNAILDYRMAQEQEQQRQQENMQKSIVNAAGAYDQKQDEAAMAQYLQSGGDTLGQLSPEMQLKAYNARTLNQYPEMYSPYGTQGPQFYNSGKGYRPLPQSTTGGLTDNQQLMDAWRREQAERDERNRAESIRLKLEEERGKLLGESETEKRANIEAQKANVPFTKSERLNQIEEELKKLNMPKPETSGGSGTPAPPKVGEVRQGYRYIGGDPADPASWEFVE